MGWVEHCIIRRPLSAMEDAKFGVGYEDLSAGIEEARLGSDAYGTEQAGIKKKRTIL